MMVEGCVHAILHAGETVGGIVAFRRGDECHLGRIWVDPAVQGRGIGRAAIEWLHAEFAQARRWTLDTPRFAIRNQKLYESLGYRRVGETTVAGGLRLILYEREIA
jgi:GNAT superfamily N-acetyltransferase